MRAKSKTIQVLKKPDDQHQAGFVPRGDIGTFLGIPHVSFFVLIIIGYGAPHAGLRDSGDRGIDRGMDRGVRESGGPYAGMRDSAGDRGSYSPRGETGMKILLFFIIFFILLLF